MKGLDKIHKVHPTVFLGSCSFYFELATRASWMALSYPVKELIRMDENLFVVKEPFMIVCCIYNHA